MYMLGALSNVIYCLVALVQNGSNCKCGNSFGVYGVADNCTTPCGGDANQSCGGLDAYSIFKMSGKFACCSQLIHLLYGLDNKIQIFAQ